MRVLAVTSEVYPLVKTGGLADVAGALPPALAAHGAETRTLLPGYPAVMAAVKRAKPVVSKHSALGVPLRLIAAKIEGLDLLIIDAPSLYDRPGGPYGDAAGADHPDNWLRFAVLGQVAADIAGGLVRGWRPDLVHAHDWQGAMAAAYLRFGGHGQPSVVTVHNLAFQGHFPATVFARLGLPESAYAMDGVEYYGGVGFLKAGLQAADAITTGSPTYAAEIMTSQFGMGLDGLMTARAGAMHGIVNGIDTDVWNPETDPHLETGFSARRLKGRSVNRRAVEVAFGLDGDADPLFVVISRLTWQKGVDLVLEASESILTGAGTDAGGRSDTRLVILGAGEHAIEDGLFALQDYGYVAFDAPSDDGRRILLGRLGDGGAAVGGRGEAVHVVAVGNSVVFIKSLRGRQERRIVPEMPFPETGRGVAVGFAQVRDRGFRRIETDLRIRR